MNRNQSSLGLLAAMPVIALIATITALNGFELTGASWPASATSYRINPNFLGTAVGSTQDQIEALQCGAVAWRQQGQSNINLSYIGTTSANTIDDNDNIQAVFYDSTPESGGTLATTWTTFTLFNNNLVHFDMIFHGANDFGSIDWNAVGDSLPFQTDLQGVAAHEFGHAIGIDHTPILAATMFASYATGDESIRTLHPDDVAATQFLYGANPTINDGPEINDVDPSEGPTAGGNSVTILGENFTWEADTTLRIDGTPLSSFSWNLENSGRLEITNMPAGAPGPVSIEIQNSLGTFTLNNAYSYGGVPPTLSSVSPNSGPVAGGNTVSLIGTNLASNAAVLFGTQIAPSVTQVSAEELSVVVPAGFGAGSVNVTVSQDSGSVILPNGYLYSTNLIRLESVDAPIGSRFVSQALATTDIQLSGFSIGVEYDGSFLSLTDLTTAGTAAAGAEFFEQGANDSGGPDNTYWTAGVIMSFDGSTLLPIGNEFPVLRATYAVEAFAPAGVFSILDIVDGAGSPPTALIFSPPSGVAITPFDVDALLEFVLGGFVRGDSNQDGNVDVADPVYTLAFLFSMGPGGCDDAFDANDDGMIDIADPVYVLAYLFSGGPDPAPPFPNEGSDPTPDGLGCN